MANSTIQGLTTLPGSISSTDLAIVYDIGTGDTYKIEWGSLFTTLLALYDSDDLPQGTTNLYLTAAERSKLTSLAVIAQATDPEKTAATVTAPRLFSPKDIKDMVVLHAVGGTSSAGLIFRGAWATATAYAVNDWVTYNGGLYRVLIAHTSSTAPSADLANYELISGNFQYEGAWVSGRNYAVNDVVLSSGVFYQAITAHLSSGGNIPPGANWVAFGSNNVLVPYSFTPDISGGNVSLNINNGEFQKHTATGNVTVTAITNWKANQLNQLYIAYLQDGTGKRQLNFAPGLNIQWQTYAPNWTAALANKEYHVWLYRDGATGIIWGTHDVPQVEVLGQLYLSDLVTDLAVATNRGYWTFPFDVYVTGLDLHIMTPATGANVIVDMNITGSSMFSTRPAIEPNESHSATGVVGTLSTNLVPAYSRITFDIDQVGSGTKGKGLLVSIMGYRA